MGAMNAEGLLSMHRNVLYAATIDFPEDSTDLKQPESLVNLCCKHIVRNSTVTLRAVSSCPIDVYEPLMSAALDSDSDRAMEVLLAHWPYSSLNLARLAPKLFEHAKFAYRQGYKVEQLRRAVKFTTCMSHSFIESLKGRMPTKLKCLDLTGFPLAEVMVKYLTSHSMLVFNEQRQNDIIDMYDQASALLPDGQREHYTREQTLPNRKLVIAVEAHVTDHNAHLELCRTLKLQFTSTFRLVLTSVCLSFVGTARVVVTLELVNPEFIRGLSLQFNRLGNNGFDLVLVLLDKFTNLENLDLSCNNIRLHDNPSVLAKFCEVLADFKKLKKLDLSHSRLKRVLSQIVPAIGKHVEHLHLCGCSLADEDLTALTTIAPQLQWLNISANSIDSSSRVIMLCTIIGKATKLEALEIEECSLQRDIVIGNLPEALCSSKTLRYLNIAENKRGIDSAGLVLLVGTLVEYSQLNVIRISLPDNIEEVSNDSEQYMLMIQIMLQNHKGAAANTKPVHIAVAPVDEIVLR